MTTVDEMIEEVEGVITGVKEKKPTLEDNLNTHALAVEYFNTLTSIVEVIGKYKDVLNDMPEGKRGDYGWLRSVYRMWENNVKIEMGNIRIEDINYVKAHNADPKIALDQPPEEIEQQNKYRACKRIAKESPLAYKGSLYSGILHGLNILTEVVEHLKQKRDVSTGN